MSLNYITYHCPTLISWSEACPGGMGGYDSMGNAWQFKLSNEDSAACQSQNNSLEFIAAFISVWVVIMDKQVQKETCFLALCDNSSGEGWLHKANIDESKNLPLHMAARKFAGTLLQVDCCLYSQHIAGPLNVVADTVSRRFDLSHKDLTSFILSNYTKQVPHSFRIHSHKRYTLG
jgi:hypothetical protein